MGCGIQLKLVSATEMASNLCRHRWTKTGRNVEMLDKVSSDMIYREFAFIISLDCEKKIFILNERLCTSIWKLKLWHRQTNESRSQRKATKKVASFRSKNGRIKNNVRKERVRERERQKKNSIEGACFTLLLTSLAFFNFGPKLLSWIISLLSLFPLLSHSVFHSIRLTLFAPFQQKPKNKNNASDIFFNEY